MDSFAGAFKLYQTGWIRGSTTIPIATDGSLIYGIDGSGEQPIDFDEVTFHHGEPHASGPDFEAAGVKQCDLILPDDGTNIWYIIEQVEDTDLLLRSTYYNPNPPVNPPYDFVGNATVQPQACGIKALQGSISITDGGHVTDAYGLYLPQIDDPSNTVKNKWGLYQAGEDYFNYMGGRLAIGADVDGYYPTNTVIYLDKHYGAEETSKDTNYGGYMEVTQGSSLYVTGQNRFPATLECKYTYDTTEDTPWSPLGWDIRTKVIDGRFMIVNSGRINYAAGLTAGVNCHPKSQYQVYPGADVAVGVRGGIALTDPRDAYSVDTWNYGDATCFSTYVDIAGGHVKRLAGVGVHTMDISDGHIDEVAGVAIEHLIKRYTDATFGAIYGFRQEGHEENLFNGYMTVDSNIGTYDYDGLPTPPPFEAENFINIGAKSFFELKRNYVEISDKLIGFKYSTPEIKEPINYDLSVENSYCMYLETSKIDGIENSWGIYQEGNDPNYFGGEIETNGNLSVSGDADIDGKITIAGTEKVRAYRATSVQSFLSSGWHKVELDGESYDNLGSFDNTTNYQFTASMDGYYQINATVQFGATHNTDQIGISIYKNGNQYSSNLGRGFDNNFISLSISDIIPLNEDDTIQLWVWIPDTDARVRHTQSGTYLTIHKIS